MSTFNIRKKQCKACPWKVSTDPEKDIPGGYCAQKHIALENTIQRGFMGMGGPVRLMACYETPQGKEQVCTGWFENQLGPGNNISLRLAVSVLKVDLSEIQLDGDQHETFEDTLPKRRRKRC
jgi:hypothetical protein